jgi:carotenoid cleavage dioxygenase
MMHDIGITANYTIILDFPLYNKSFQFDPTSTSRFGVMPRHATSDAEVIWIEAPAAYAFHVANAWETVNAGGGTSITLVCGATPMLDMLNLQGGTSPIKLTEYILDLQTAKCTSIATLVGDKAMEFPVVHPRTIGRKSRYTYFPFNPIALNGDTSDALRMTCVAKYDFDERRVVGVHEFQDSGVGAELVFATKGVAEPASVGGAEDDGYLVTYLHHPKADTSTFYVVDARTMELVTCMTLPQRVPFGFHGWWVSQEEIESQKLD